MTAVFDPPVAPNRVRELLHSQWQTAHVVPDLFRGLAFTLCGEFHKAHCRQSPPSRATPKRLRDRELKHLTGLLATVSLSFARDLANCGFTTLVVELVGHKINDRSLQVGLVVFDRQQVVTTLLDNFVSNRLLSPRGIDCDNRPLQVDKVQRCGNCRIFARFLVCADLCQG